MRLPDDLLEQARHLAKREPKRPKQASLRRAISTGYYALFHLLITEAIQNWKRPAERNTLARMFEHGFMRTACINQRDELNRYFKTYRTPCHDLTVAQHLHFIAEAFIGMHHQRESADYDYSSTWARTDVQPKLDEVSEAFQRWKIIRNEGLAQDFLVTLLLKKR